MWSRPICGLFLTSNIRQYLVNTSVFSNPFRCTCFGDWVPKTLTFSPWKVAKHAKIQCNSEQPVFCASVKGKSIFWKFFCCDIWQYQWSVKCFVDIVHSDILQKAATYLKTILVYILHQAVPYFRPTLFAAPTLKFYWMCSHCLHSSKSGSGDLFLKKSCFLRLALLLNFWIQCSLKLKKNYFNDF